MTELPTSLAIDAERLWLSIMETARIGATAKGGICRLTLTDSDAEVRRWFIAACEQAGLNLRIDEMGNIYARRLGRDRQRPPIAVGSHLDTQPSGGKFDGVIGVLAGLEMIRVLNTIGYETNAPIEIINWTNEEGSRFSPPMLGSGVYTGRFSRDFAYNQRDRAGLRFSDELAHIGFLGSEPCAVAHHPLSAFFELHIEQGPILEAERKMIGVVTGVQGIRWYEATVSGMACHTGSTPMAMRADALLAAARIIQAVNGIALAYAPFAVGTVGLIEAKPNSRNVIAGECFFTVDFRHPEEDVLETMGSELAETLARIAEDGGVSVIHRRIWNAPAVQFHPDCIAVVHEAAATSGYPACEIISGAGHDAAYVAAVVPTAMIFVPCERGISHNEIEKTKPEEVAAGTNVLLRAVLAMDTLLAERDKT